MANRAIDLVERVRQGNSAPAKANNSGAGKHLTPTVTAEELDRVHVQNLIEGLPDRVNKYFQDYDNFYRGAQKRLGEFSWSDGYDAYGKLNPEINQYISRGEQLQQILTKYKGYFNTEWYNEAMQGISGLGKYNKEMRQWATDAQNWYRQFDSQEGYDNYIAQQTQQRDMDEMTVPQMQQRIQQMESDLYEWSKLEVAKIKPGDVGAEQTYRDEYARRQRVINQWKNRAKEKKDAPIAEADTQEFSTWTPQEQENLREWLTVRPGTMAWAEVLPADQRRISGNYSALTAKYGEERVKQIAETIDRQMGGKVTAAAAEQGGKGGIGQWFTARGANLLAAFANPFGIMDSAALDTGRYAAANPNHAGNTLNVYANAVDESNAEWFKEKLGAAGYYGYQALTSAADNTIRTIFASSILGPGSAMLEGASLGLAGLQGFGSSYNQHIQNGASRGEAMTLAVIDAGTEILTEKMPFENLMKIVKGNPKTATQIILDIFKQAGTEILEEEASLIVGAVAEWEILKERSQWQKVYENFRAQGLTDDRAKKHTFQAFLKEMVDTAIVSGGSGLISGTGGALVNRYVYGQKPISKAQSKEVNAITQKFTEGGMNAEEAQVTAGQLWEASQPYGEQAKAVQAAYEPGQDVNQFARGFALAYSYGESGSNQEALSKVEAAQYISESQRDIAYTMGKEAKAKADRQMKKDELGKLKSSYDVGTDGKTYQLDTDDEIEIKGFASMGGKPMLDIGKGKKVAADNVKYASTDEAVLYETIGKVAGSVSNANTMLKMFREQDTMSASDYAAGLEEAYEAGRIGTMTERQLRESEFASQLPVGVASVAYNRGVARGKGMAQVKQGILNAATKGEAKPGQLHFDAEDKNLNQKQKTALGVLDTLAKTFGLQIHVFESYEKNGSLVYKNANGEEVKAPNGWYDPSDGSIHIDLNAGNAGEGTMMFTIAHELTHFIKQWSPVKYRVLADILVKKYAEQGQSVAELIQNQKDKAERNGRKLTTEEAFDEVVADSMETMLLQKDTAQFMAEVQQRDKSLWQKLKAWFKDLADKLSKAIEAYGDVDASTPEGRMVAQMGDAIRDLQKAYAEALVDAGATYQKNGQKNIPRDGGEVRYMAGASEGVNPESVENMDLDIDTKTESVSPSLIFSERTWTESDYVRERDKAAEEIAKAIGVTAEKAKAYIDDVNSIAKMISDDRTRLDYFSSPYRSSFVGNVEYGGSFDFSTLCPKRRLLTGTFSAIQKALPNTALTVDEILEIRNRMAKAGLTVNCGCCYVEGSRANMGKFSKEFLRLYKQYYPDAWQPDMVDVNTPEGVEWMRINHPEAYEQYEYFWNHYGTLKPGDKNLFASQQKPKLYQLHTEYKSEILQKFKNDDTVEEKNRNGGIRMQSFSDFEIVHLIDCMQIIMDMSRVGLAGQAYTKIPEFAWALGDTGLKINLSLFAKGVDENGKLIFDDVEGMPHEEAFNLRKRYSKNVGTVFVAYNDKQLMAAMADDRIDYIIPFHRSQWKKSQYAALGLPKDTKDFTNQQNEKYIKPQYHEYRGRMVKDKATNYMPNEYWDFSKSGKENAIAYLEMCARNNKRPKFYKLLTDNKDGSYSLKADGSTDGYWKLLIDFKMYDNEGNGSPQMPVAPKFNMEKSKEMLDKYEGGHASFPAANGIVEQFVAEYKDGHKGQILSDRDPTAAATQAEIEKQNEKLREDVANLRALLKLQGKVTHGTVFKKSSVDAAGRYLAQYAGAKLDAEQKKQLSTMLNDFYTFIATDDALAWESVKEKADPIAKFLQDNVVIKQELSDYAKDVLREIRGTKISLDDSQKAEVAYLYGSYEAFRKSAFSSVIFTDKGIPLDTFWHEMTNMFPGTFDGDVSANDQPGALMDIIDSMRNSDTSRLEYEYNRDMIKVDLIRAVYDSYWRVDNLRTVADRNQKKVNDLKGKHAQKMQEMRDSKDKAIAEIRANKDKQIAKIREDYRKSIEKRVKQTAEKYEQRIANDSNRRDKTALRKKIRRAIRDINKILLRGDKKRNVKEGLQDLAYSALASAEMLFTDTVSNDDLIKSGVGVTLTERESKMLNEAKDIMAELDNPPAVINEDNMGEWFEREEALKQRLSSLRYQLRDVFERERIRLDNITVQTLMTNLSDTYAQIKDAEEDYIRGAYNEDIYQHLLTLKDGFGVTRVKDMRLDQLEALYDAYTMVMTTIRDANKNFAENLKETRETLGKQAVQEVKAAGGEKLKRTKLGKWLNSLSWNNEKPIFAFARIGSETLKKLYDNIRKGQDTWALDMVEADKFRRDAYAKFNRKKWDMDKPYTFTAATGEEFSLSLEQIMSIYAYSKREQAYDHLLKGGFVFDGETEIRDIVNGVPVTQVIEDATAYKLSVELLQEITSKLTDEQRKFVDTMQDYLSATMGEKGNQVSMKMYGIKLFKEKFYFPLKSAGQYMEKAKEADLKKQQGQISLANAGFSKAVKPNASNPVVLSNFMDVWADHVNEMSMYHAFVLPMEDFRRVYNYKTPNIEGESTASVNQAIQNAYGKAATDYIDQLYRDLNGGAISDPREGAAKMLTGAFKKAKVMLSASVVAQQPSAIGRAYALIDPKYFGALPILKGVGRAVTDKVNHKHEQLWNELKKYAPVALIKEMGYFDTGMGRSARDFLQAEEYHGFGEKFKGFFNDSDYRDEVLSSAAAKADELTWIQIWNAVKNETADLNKDMDRNSEAFLKLAGDRFAEVIDKTQVYDSVLARSANMRSKTLFMNIATAFMAEPTVSANMLEEAVREGMAGNKKKAARIVGAVYLSVVINSALSALVYSARDDDEDETWLEKYLSSFFSEVVDGINPITYYPFLKDIWSLLQGYDIERTDMSLFADAIDKLQSIVKLCAKETNGMTDEQLAEHHKKLAKAWLGALDSVTALVGIPIANVRRDATAVVNMVDTVGEDLSGRRTTWESLKNAVFESVKSTIPVASWFNSKSNADKLLDATLAGDKAYVKRLQSEYKDEAAIQSAMRTAIKNKYLSGKISESKAYKYLEQYGGAEDEDEAFFIVQKWETKDGKYDALYRAVLSGNGVDDAMDTLLEHGVNAKTIQSNLRSTIGKWYYDEESETRIERDEAYEMLIEHGGMKPKEAEAQLLKWDMKLETGISYSEAKDAFQGGDLTEEEAISYLQTYGGLTEEEALERVKDWKFESDWGFSYDDVKLTYQDGEISRDEALQVMMEDGGMLKTAAEAKLRKWDCKLETGIDYDDIEEEFVSGNITAQQAIEYRVKYGGEDRENAEDTVLKWQMEYDTGYKYNDLADAVTSGEVSEGNAIKWLVKYGGKKEEDAPKTVQAWKWRYQNPQYKSLGIEQIDSYLEFCEPAGVDIQYYYDIVKFSSKTENDINAAGKSVRYSAVRKVCAEINKLPISRAQKEAIAVAMGWSKSTISRCRLW